MKEILKYIVLILLISISNQKDFRYCYEKSYK